MDNFINYILAPVYAFVVAFGVGFLCYCMKEGFVAGYTNETEIRRALTNAGAT